MLKKYFINYKGLGKALHMANNNRQKAIRNENYT